LVRGTVWKNESENGPFFSVSFSRLYKSDENRGQWRDAYTFSRDDLPLISKVADRIHDWIFEANQGKAGDVGQQAAAN
jgi:hypothetical protein